MSNLSFGNWQRFLDEQTNNTTLVRDIILKRNTRDVFMKVLQHDNLRSCQWILEYFQKVCGVKNTSLKNEKTANSFRCKGNLAFKKKNYMAALEEYNNAILRATRPTDTTETVSASELALSFGNRSAVYFYMERYQECLSDIEAAKISGYPSLLKCKLHIRQAKCHVKQSCRCQAELSIAEAEGYLKHVETSKQESAADEISRVKIEARKLSSDMSKSDTIPVPLHGFHSILTQASAALDLKVTENQGRHLVANCDIKAGEVLIVEKPYASVLLPDFYSTHCHHCYVRLTAFYPCRECLRVKFCSPQCEMEAWSIYHYVECPYQDLLHSIGIAHLSLRVILTAGLSHLTDIQDKLEEYNCSRGKVSGLTEEGRYERNYFSVYSLMPHVENMQPEDLTQYALTARLLLYVLEHSGYFGSIPVVKDHQTSIPTTELTESLQHLSLAKSDQLGATKLYIGSLLLRHICQLVCNGHAITEMQLTQGDISDVVDTQTQERIATAIYPTTSLLNHSCQPTIINSFIKNLLVVRTLRPVKSGEQVYNCYGPHFGRMEYRERQTSLKSQYFFTCQCTACVDQGKLEALYTAVACLKCRGPVPVTGEFHSICLECQNVINTQDIIVKVSEDQKAFISAVKLMDCGDLKDCLRLLLRTLESQSKHLYRHNRDLSQTQDAVAKCYSMAGQYDQAVPYLRQAMQTTELIYGKNSIECGYELQKYAELLLRAGQKEECYQATQKAIALFRLFYGKEHTVLEELSQLMAVARYS